MSFNEQLLYFVNLLRYSVYNDFQSIVSTLCHENVHLFIFWITLSKITDFNNFWYIKSREKIDMNVLQICPRHLADISAQRSELCYWSVSKKYWKHVLTQKVVTLNTCCGVACLTFQLPRITTSSFQSHRRQPTTGCFQSLQRLKERNKPSVRWKSFAIHKLVLWHF